ncbi:MAG: efflux RND transporter periplasmic adaptor subunit [Verrucomicrobiae bacterium]|nr:efflux RND transporter periplasmic adaptor subunit [Verrucomicrobiae bacterium]
MSCPRERARSPFRQSPTAVPAVVACLLAASLLAACGKRPKPDEGRKNIEIAIPVEVQPVARGPIESTLRTFATLEAEQEVKVFARTANRVVVLHVEEGDEVAQDAVLLELDDTNQRVALARAENSLTKARQELERLSALHAQNLISDQVFHDTQFEVRGLELALADARRELDHTVVRAPLAGTLTRRLVNLGDLVNVNQHLFDLVDFGSIVARIHIPEKNLTQVAVGQIARVTATALGDRSFPGVVRRIAPIVDARSGTVRLTVGFDDIGPLRPGMYVDVELILGSNPDAILLSKRALILDGDQTYAFRLDEGRRVRRIRIEARASDRFHVEPATGFADGDFVVIAGQTGLKDGALVRLPDDPEPAQEPQEKSAGLSAAKR